MLLLYKIANNRGVTKYFPVQRKRNSLEEDATDSNYHQLSSETAGLIEAVMVFADTDAGGDADEMPVTLFSSTMLGINHLCSGRST